MAKNDIGRRKMGHLPNAIIPIAGIISLFIIAQELELVGLKENFITEKQFFLCIESMI